MNVLVAWPFAGVSLFTTNLLSLQNRIASMCMIIS